MMVAIMMVEIGLLSGAMIILMNALTAHSHCLNCYQKGKAFWWMMARIAGWDGNITSSVEQDSIGTDENYFRSERSQSGNRK